MTVMMSSNQGEGTILFLYFHDCLLLIASKENWELLFTFPHLLNFDMSVLFYVGPEKYGYVRLDPQTTTPPTFVV